MLLICAGLMINTLTRVLRTSPGFTPEHLLTAEVRLTGDKSMDATDPGNSGLNAIRPPVGELCRQVLERLQNIPGVEVGGPPGGLFARSWNYLRRSH